MTELELSSPGRFALRMPDSVLGSLGIVFDRLTQGRARGCTQAV